LNALKELEKLSEKTLDYFSDICLTKFPCLNLEIPKNLRPIGLKISNI
jgi:hypothetical protein